MNRPEAVEYRQALANILKTEPNPHLRRSFLNEERNTSQYREAQLLSGKSKIEALLNKREMQAAENERELTPTEKVRLWASDKLEEFYRLPTGTGSERKQVKSFVSDTARFLVEHPDHIDAAGSVWITYAQEQADKSGRPFYDQIKEACTYETREYWDKLDTAQIAELVRQYAHGILTKDLSGTIIANYFKGPHSQRQQIDSL